MNYKQSDRKFIFTLIFSLIIHVLFLVIKTPQKNQVSKNDKKEKKIRIVLNPPKKVSEEDKKQIVATEKTDNKKTPEDSKFLSETSQSVDRQVVAKKVDKFKAAFKGDRNGQMVKTVSAPKKIKSSKKKSKKGEISWKDLSFNNTQNEQEAVEEAAAVATAQGVENGTDSEVGLASNNDYVQDVALGDMTNLNTTEFKYYGFYFRIRQRLEQYWGSSLKDKAVSLYKQGRRLPSSVDMITSLIITLNDAGKIIDVQVKSSSGVSELDDAAIESFNKAGPFPNPPKGMATNGVIKIEWGFVVKG